MRIALCLEYPLGLRGGVSVIVENLAGQLVRLGHTIVLVSPDTRETLEGAGASKLIEQHIYWNSPRPTLAESRKLAEQLAESRINVVHFHAGGNYGWGNRFPFRSPAYYVSRTGIPVVWTSHRADTILDGFCGPQKPLLFKLLMFPVAWFGKIQQTFCSRSEIAVSLNNLNKLRRWYWPCRSRFVQIYHSRLREEAAAGKKIEREPMVLCVGHFAEVKGQTILTEAFGRIAKKHPEFTLLLTGHAGTDDTLARLRKIINGFQIEKQVKLPGEQTDTEMLMRRAAIYVQPSLNEALGLALQEAMYYGCAVIASQVGGIPELVQTETNGLLFDAGEVEQLARNLERLINSAAERGRLGQFAAASIRDRGMTLEKMTRRHLEIYAHATGKA
jgi:glycosyltransferase involved in cell wall biosynthesis